MSEQTKIAWCDSTVNFWSGCTKVSAGCANCYAETLSNRFNGVETPNGTLGKWGKGAPRKLHESAFKLAVKLSRKPWVCSCGHSIHHTTSGPCVECGAAISYHRRRIFSLSLGDWLDPEVPVEWLARMLDTIRQCQDVEWLLCSKRVELFDTRLREVMNDHGGKWGDELAEWIRLWLCVHNPPPNIVLLASVENQEQADKRIPELLRIPAWRRGLSCEPLLGSVELNLTKRRMLEGRGFCDSGIDWVIVGGESGPHARPCNVEWVRSLKDQCKAAAVPCFVKQIQIGGKLLKESKDFPEDLQIQQFYEFVGWADNSADAELWYMSGAER